jgi:hypothetical protein
MQGREYPLSSQGQMVSRYGAIDLLKKKKKKKKKPESLGSSHKHTPKSSPKLSSTRSIHSSAAYCLLALWLANCEPVVIGPSVLLFRIPGRPSLSLLENLSSFNPLEGAQLSPQKVHEESIRPKNLEIRASKSGSRV